MKTKKAAGPTAAKQHKLHKKLYRKPTLLSSLKFHIGELLLFGDKRQMNFWSAL